MGSGIASIAHQEIAKASHSGLFILASVRRPFRLREKVTQGTLTGALPPLVTVEP